LSPSLEALTALDVVSDTSLSFETLATLAEDDVRTATRGEKGQYSSDFRKEGKENARLLEEEQAEDEDDTVGDCRKGGS
jgi:hypothetical protein